MPENTSMTCATASAFEAMFRDRQVCLQTLDGVFWAIVKKLPYPLTHYDLDYFEEALRHGDPEARAVSNPLNALRYLRQRHQKITCNTVQSDDGTSAVTTAEITVPNYGLQSRARVRIETPVEESGRAIALAVLYCDADASRLQQRLLAVAGLREKMPPVESWPIEMMGNGRYYPIHHDLQLASFGGLTPDQAREQIDLNHKGDYGLMLMRERYAKLTRNTDQS